MFSRMQALKRIGLSGKAHELCNMAASSVHACAKCNGPHCVEGDLLESTANSLQLAAVGLRLDTERQHIQRLPTRNASTQSNDYNPCLGQAEPCAWSTPGKGLRSSMPTGN